MAISFVQQATPIATLTSATTTTITLPTVTEGNDVVVVVGIASKSDVLVGVTDDLGHTYTQGGICKHSTYNMQTSVWRARMTTGSASTVTITVTHSSLAIRRELFAYEWAGLSTSAAEAVTTDEDATAVAYHPIGPSANLSTTGGVFISTIFANNNASGWSEDTGDPSWTLRTTSPTTRSCVQDLVVSGADGRSALCISAAAVIGAMLLVAYIASGTAGLTATVYEYEGD